MKMTGGTSGIGRALAEAFHDRGNRVVVTGRRQALLDEIMAARPGLIGMLVANAGISRTEDVVANGWDASEAEAIVRTNILGVLQVAAAFLPVLKTRSDAAILATSSALAFVPRADFPTYCASKAFLHSWLVSLRHQLRRIPIEVLELSPPYVQTELTGAQQASDPRAMPLGAYVGEVMRMLEHADHPRGELLLERDQARRWAERNGSYDALFAAMNLD